MCVLIQNFVCRYETFRLHICGKYFKSSAARRMHTMKVHSNSSEDPDTMETTSRGHKSPNAPIDDDHKMDITIDDQPTTSALVDDVDNKMDESSLSDSSTRSSTTSLTALASLECVLCAKRFVRCASLRMHTLRSHSKKADISRVTSESMTNVESVLSDTTKIDDEDLPFLCTAAAQVQLLSTKEVVIYSILTAVTEIRIRGNEYEPIS